MSLFSEKQTQNLRVEGMHCEKCVARVTQALEDVEGVTSANVSLESASATVEGRGFDAAALVAAVQEAGFEASIA
ncbi:MAG: heavy-metal-associated domain-containing protein [Eggerthellaceae bacterium]|nr:heavy-metal-associated domain-containing protein [Eggerthellaceae bacterium]